MLTLPFAAEHVHIGCQIITSCVLLGQGPFLQQYAGAVLHSLQAMIGKPVAAALSCELPTCTHVNHLCSLHWLASVAAELSIKTWATRPSSSCFNEGTQHASFDIGTSQQWSCPFTGNVNEKGMLVLFTTLEIILQCFPKEGPGLLQPVLHQLLGITLSGEEGNLTVTSKHSIKDTPSSVALCRGLSRMHAYALQLDVQPV